MGEDKDPGWRGESKVPWWWGRRSKGARSDLMTGSLVRITTEVVIVSKKFVYWYFSVAGIAGALIAITGISWLFYFSPLARTHLLNVLGYLTLAFFIFVLIFSGWVFYRRKQFGETPSL